MEGGGNAQNRLEVIHTVRVGEARVLLQVKQKIFLTYITGTRRAESSHINEARSWGLKKIHLSFSPFFMVDIMQ